MLTGQEIKHCYLCEIELHKWDASCNTFNEPVCAACCIITINSKIKEVETHKKLRGTTDWFVHEAGKYNGKRNGQTQ
jgi:hypothetical protein